MNELLQTVRAEALSSLYNYFEQGARKRVEEAVIRDLIKREVVRAAPDLQTDDVVRLYTPAEISRLEKPEPVRRWDTQDCIILPTMYEATIDGIPYQVAESALIERGYSFPTPAAFAEDILKAAENYICERVNDGCRRLLKEMQSHGRIWKS